jgi:uncharacterized protein YdiU (UPF0061 family)
MEDQRCKYAYRVKALADAPNASRLLTSHRHMLPMLLTDYHPDPLFAMLGLEFSDPIDPAQFPAHILRVRGDRHAASIGLAGLSDAEWIDHFGRFRPLPGQPARPLAMRYHGHQFRNYNPDIGDGRGFLFAQLRDSSGRLMDLGTKGSGQTPYSRFGDGRLTLKGGVREALATAMLEALGVKTSRTLSLIETGEALQRNDEPSPTRSSVLVRLQHSHIRFGTFQRHAYYQSNAALRTLVDHCVNAYAPELLAFSDGERPAGLLAHVVQASAELAASWMAAGFVHGVLNTDNMVVTGESFDYGPWRFLPRSEPGFTAAYFDQTGLYAFGRQPSAVAWNLQQLASCLTLISETDPLIEALRRFEAAYQTALRDKVFAVLGLQPSPSLADDLEALTAFYTWLTDTGLSWPQVHFDLFCGQASAQRWADSPLAAAYRDTAFHPVRDGLLARDPARPERLGHAYFQAVRPETLLIEDVEGLWDAIAADDDWTLFEAKLNDIETMRLAYSG